MALIATRVFPATTTQPQAFTEAELDKRIARVTADSAEELKFLRTFEVTDPETFEQSATQRAKLKTELEEIEAERRSFTDPLNDVIKRINAKVKPATTFLDTAIKLIGASMGAFQQREEARQTAELEAAAALAQAGDVASATLALARVESEMPKVAGLSSTDLWDFELIPGQEHLIPREFMKPDEVKIRAFVKAAKKENALAGVRSFVKKVFTQRTSTANQ